MSENVFRVCRFCHHRQPVYFDTDGRGGIVEEPLACGCDAKRNPVVGPKRCTDCPSSVVGRALRCEPCKKVAVLEFLEALA